MKHILLPTDFSPNSWNAIFTALKLYAGVECRFYIMHAYEPKAAEILGEKGKQRLGALYDSMSAYSEQELDKVLEYLHANHTDKKHQFEKLSVKDDLLDAIDTLIGRKPLDLLVMGTQGATAARGVFMGSNTVKVIKKIRNKPLLVVPEDFDLQSLKSVVFPTDFSRPHEPFELQLLIELLNAWKASLKVFHLALEFELSDTQQAVKKLLHRRLAGISHSFHQVDRTLKLSKAIENFASEQEAQMIALIHYEHTFMEKLTRESVVKKIGFHTNVPLLVLPGQ